ncbi:hypothetical protein EX30DRAFT_371636 [Ascodesmis nigricans]|uniref:Biogenesis of lysosome-related organelles complex 1 subunit 1 n=1 Tax=Ascodesmis nigricans TaxID=341454 RepID=A0A4S2MX75_9PEZI|nr:hypothetical protein EX30DRAFT_371636 [Ascodesmis nigricans]
MSTARLIKDDALARKERYRLADQARQTLTTSLSTLSTRLDRDLRDRITTIHANQASLDSQSRALKLQTKKLVKTTKAWSGMADAARGGLKEIGDVQNWAEMIEYELMLVEETLRIVHEE